MRSLSVAGDAPESGRRLRERVADVAVSVLIAVSGRLPTDHVVPPWDAKVFVLNAVSALLLLARRRRPFVVLCAVVCATWAGVWLGSFGTGQGLAVAVATYSVAATLPRRRAAAAAGAAAVSTYAASMLGSDGGPQFLLVVLLGGAIGDAIRNQRAHMHAMRERAERAERTRDALARQRVAEDRLSIARDLHDAVAHQIAVINLHAGRASSALRTRPDDAEQSLVTIRGASRTVLQEIGDLLATLRDPDAVDAAPAGLGLLDDVVREFTVHGLTVAVNMEGVPRELPAAVDVVALRTVQEALTNAHKHGAGNLADVVVRYADGRLEVVVANPARADAAPEVEAPTRGHGLVGMRERIESVRGSLTHGPTGSGTWLLCATLPTAGAVSAATSASVAEGGAL